MDISPKAGHLERGSTKEEKGEREKRDYYLIKKSETNVYMAEGKRKKIVFRKES